MGSGCVWLGRREAHPSSRYLIRSGGFLISQVMATRLDNSPGCGKTLFILDSTG
jgi:hypothetical protein